MQRRLRLLRERERAQPRELGEAPGTRLEVDDERHKSLDKGWATALGTGARRGWERVCLNSPRSVANPHLQWAMPTYAHAQPEERAAVSAVYSEALSMLLAALDELDEEPARSLMAPELASGWEPVTARDGRTYYWNSETEDASWVLPPELAHLSVVPPELPTGTPAVHFDLGEAPEAPAGVPDLPDAPEAPNSLLSVPPLPRDD